MNKKDKAHLVKEGLVTYELVSSERVAWVSFSKNDLLRELPDIPG